MHLSTKRRITAVFLCFAAVALALPSNVRIRAQDPQTMTDQDNDGLTDFQERHKYFTDPTFPMGCNEAANREL